MKNKRAIQKRISQLLGQELTRRLRESSQRLPVKCVHNYRHPLDSRKTVEGEQNPQYNRISDQAGHIGLCMLGAETPDEWSGTICEDPIDAQRCPYFEARRAQKDIFNEFRQQLSDSTWVQENLPEVATLAWVLDLAPEAGFWLRLRFRLLRLFHRKVEPVRQVPLLEALNDESARS